MNVEVPNTWQELLRGFHVECFCMLLHGSCGNRVSFDPWNLLCLNLDPLQN